MPPLIIDFDGCLHRGDGTRLARVDWPVTPGTAGFDTLVQAVAAAGDGGEVAVVVPRLGPDENTLALVEQLAKQGARVSAVLARQAVAQLGLPTSSSLALCAVNSRELHLIGPTEGAASGSRKLNVDLQVRLRDQRTAVRETFLHEANLNLSARDLRVSDAQIDEWLDRIISSDSQDLVWQVGVHSYSIARSTLQPRLRAIGEAVVSSLRPHVPTGGPLAIDPALLRRFGLDRFFLLPEEMIPWTLISPSLLEWIRSHTQPGQLLVVETTVTHPRFLPIKGNAQATTQPGNTDPWKKAAIGITLVAAIGGVILSGLLLSRKPEVTQSDLVPNPSPAPPSAPEPSPSLPPTTLPAAPPTSASPSQENPVSLIAPKPDRPLPSKHIAGDAFLRNLFEVDDAIPYYQEDPILEAPPFPRHVSALISRDIDLRHALDSNLNRAKLSRALYLRSAQGAPSPDRLEELSQGILATIRESIPSLFVDARERVRNTTDEYLEDIRRSYGEAIEARSLYTKLLYREIERQAMSEGIEGLARNNPSNSRFFNRIRDIRTRVQIDERQATRLESILIDAELYQLFREWLLVNRSTNWSELTSQPWFSGIDEAEAFAVYATLSVPTGQDPRVFHKLHGLAVQTYREFTVAGPQQLAGGPKALRLDDVEGIRARFVREATTLQQELSRVESSIESSIEAKFAGVYATTNRDALKRALEEARSRQLSVEDPMGFLGAGELEQRIKMAFVRKLQEEAKEYLRKNPEFAWNHVRLSIYGIQLSEENLLYEYVLDRFGRIDKSKAPASWIDLWAAPEHIQILFLNAIAEHEPASLQARFDVVGLRYLAAEADLRRWVDANVHSVRLVDLAVDAEVLRFRDALQAHMDRVAVGMLIPRSEQTEIAKARLSELYNARLSEWLERHPAATHADIGSAEELFVVPERRMAEFIWMYQLKPALQSLDLVMRDDRKFRSLREKHNGDLTGAIVEAMVDDFMRLPEVTDAVNEVAMVAERLSGSDQRPVLQARMRRLVRQRCLID